MHPALGSPHPLRRDPVINTSHPWPGEMRARPRGKHRGRGMPETLRPARPRIAAGGGGKSTARPAGRTEDSGPRDRGTGGAEKDERERSRGGTQAHGCAVGRSRSRPRPIPAPTLGPRSKDPNRRPGRRAWTGPSPVRPGLPAPPPPRASARLTRAERGAGGLARENRREAL